MDGMNKKIITIIFCLIATVVCLLHSCSADNSTEEIHLFEEPVQTENEKDTIVVDGEAPKEWEYEAEINDGY